MLRADQKLANGAGSGCPRGFLLYRSIGADSAGIVYNLYRTLVEESMTCYAGLINCMSTQPVLRPFLFDSIQRTATAKNTTTTIIIRRNSHGWVPSASVFSLAFFTMNSLETSSEYFEPS